jgi:hypothetical protein
MGGWDGPGRPVRVGTWSPGRCRLGVRRTSAHVRAQARKHASAQTKAHALHTWTALEYDTLDLSQVTQNGQAHYTLCAAIMYCEHHYWVYLHGRDQILVDDVSKLATPTTKRC